MSASRPMHIAVIGAGITGLAAAHRLISTDSSAQVTVFEAGGRTGGIIRTQHRDGFLVELGPDSFITNKPGALQLCREIGFADQLIPTDETFRRSLVLRNGRPMPVPDGFLLMAPSKPWAIATTPILSWRGKLRLLSEVFVPRRRSDDDDESLAEFVRRRFGTEALDRLVQPLIGGIYTSDPEKLSLHAALPRFPELEQRYGSVIRGTLQEQKLAKSRPGEPAASPDSGSGARYGLFLTARDGLTSMVDAIAAACQNSGRVTFETDRRVVQIERSMDTVSPEPQVDAQLARRWNVRLRDSGQPQTFDGVIVTLPADTACHVLPGDAFQRLRTALASIEYASSAIVVSAHRLADFQHRLDAFGLVIPHKERRSILAVSFSSRKFAGRAPEGHVLLRTFVGGAMQPELLVQDDAALSRLVDTELRSILGLSKSPLFSDVVRYTDAMPQYHVGHQDRVRTIEDEISRWPGLELAGSAYHGVGIPDSVSSGRHAADRLLGLRS